METKPSRMDIYDFAGFDIFGIVDAIGWMIGRKEYEVGRIQVRRKRLAERERET
jgi:hypothetical protein